jgi:two-component system chemotaxis response regulator CheB
MRRFTGELSRGDPLARSSFELIVVGTSMGGLNALSILLAGLPKSFLVPVAVVQHRHKDSDNTLSSFLQRHSTLPLKAVEDKEIIMPGWIYLAPADYHLLVEQGSFALSTEAPVSYARPSIDVLFESAADVYAERVIGVILTGANHDGAQGLAKIQQRGGLAIIQDPATAESRTMPEAAIATVKPDWILPLSGIAPCLVKLCQFALQE